MSILRNMEPLNKAKIEILFFSSGDSVQFQRVQALTRSQTQIDMKQPHHTSSPSLNSLNEDLQGVRRDLGLPLTPRKGDK